MQSVIVTGGTGGIGSSIVQELCAKGFLVYVIGHSHEPKEMHNMVRFHRCDVGKLKDVEQFFKNIGHEAAEEIIALVNNAGIYGDDRGEELLRTNILGPYYMTNSFAAYRRAHSFSGRGAVINMGSAAALHGVTRSPLYAASKSALHRLGTAQALVYAQEGLLSINTLVPGPVATNMLLERKDSLEAAIQHTPSHTLTTPREIAEMISVLIEKRNHNIVGSIITIDGGRSIS